MIVAFSFHFHRNSSIKTKAKGITEINIKEIVNQNHSIEAELNINLIKA